MAEATWPIRRPCQSIIVRSLIVNGILEEHLVAAARDSIFIFSLADGSLSSQLPRSEVVSLRSEGLLNAQSGTSDGSVPDPKEDNVKLALTSDARHLIVASEAWKCVTVYRIDEKLGLKRLSNRFVPKRPSAIALLAKDSHIICADKFGDVYSLPLFHEADSENLSSSEGFLSKSDLFSSRKSGQPAATSLTVHTKGNREALQQQLQASEAKDAQVATNPDCSLLLGHISVVTDLKVIAIEESCPSGPLIKTFILTCDRDEHIRISRGPPQSYVIENYCLGHSSFVSRLSVSPWDPQILLSGGGDDDIFVWEWRGAKLHHKFNIQKHAQNYLVGRNLGSSSAQSLSQQHADLYRSSKFASDHDEIRVAVSIVNQMVVRPILDEGMSEYNYEVLQAVIACEGISALFIFERTKNGYFKFSQTLRLKGNPLSAVSASNGQSLIVSIDAVSQPNSTSDLRKDQDGNKYFAVFRPTVKEGSCIWEDDEKGGGISDTLNEAANTNLPEISNGTKEAAQKTISSFYELSSFRKGVH